MGCWSTSEHPPLPLQSLVSLAAPSGQPPGQQLNTRSRDSLDSFGFIPNGWPSPPQLGRLAVECPALAVETGPGTRGVASPPLPL